MVGADALRLYEMFMGPFDQHISWDENGIVGTRRFIEKVWKLQEKIGYGQVASAGAIDRDSISEASRRQQVSLRGSASRETALACGFDLTTFNTLDTLMHKTIKKVSEDIESMKFNTAISSMMIAVNEFEKQTAISKEHYKILLQLLAPFAPHVTEEIWKNIGADIEVKIKKDKSIHLSSWPSFDPKKIVETTVNIMVQINGKVRASFASDPQVSEDVLKNTALNMPEIKKWIDGKEIKKWIIIKGKLVSIVV